LYLIIIYNYWIFVLKVLWEAFRKALAMGIPSLENESTAWRDPMSNVAKKPSHGIHGPMDQWRKTIFYGYFLERNCYITVISFPYHDQFHRFNMSSSKKGQQRSENGETMDNKGLLSE